ncbi:hypothetical protein [Victivallis vadensis]|jgi:hypothetical protein|uniref:hypothetical protein n=1 Tax=Victivallis vadensis TaxID=172901 RepID=UPI0023F29BC6|nr:hypothetical protein [Victivallis vadensis]
MMENRNQAEQKEESVIMEEKKQKKQNEQIIRNTPVLPQDINEAKNTPMELPVSVPEDPKKIQPLD